MFFISR